MRPKIFVTGVLAVAAFVVLFAAPRPRLRVQSLTTVRAWPCWLHPAGTTVFGTIVDPPCLTAAQLPSAYINARTSAPIVPLVSPTPPTLAPAVVVATTVTLTWAWPSVDPATSYVLEVGSASGLSDLANTDTGSTASMLTATGVPPGTYFVRVRGRNASGTSAPSNEIVVVVDAACSGVPAAPTALTASVEGSSVALTWQAPATGCAASSYLIEAGSGPGLTNLATVSTGSARTAFTAAGVQSGLYYVRVRALNGSATSPASNEVQILVGIAPCTGAPGAPSTLAAIISGASVVLTWDAASGAPTTYVIEAGSVPSSSDFATLVTGGVGTSYTATAGPGTYYIRVRAQNACGTGATSNEVVLVVGGTTGGPCVNLPGAPGNLGTFRSGESTVFFWSAPAGTVVSYVIEAGSASGQNDVAVIDTGNAVPEYRAATNLVSGTFYVRVRGRNACGIGPASYEIVREFGGGTIFRMTPDGAVTILHTLTQIEGAGPTALVQGTDGYLYGTYNYGGNGWGTAVKISPNGALNVLHRFNGTDGGFPNALLQGADGNLYGTTYSGPAAQNGNVFRMDTSGIITVLHWFTGPDGADPQRLIQASDGNFYGITSLGGAYGWGALYRMTPAGVVMLLHSFSDSPFAIVQAGDGNFYGTTFGLYSGTLFRVTPGGAFAEVRSFNTTIGNIILGSDGALYGTTTFTAYRVTLSGDMTTLHAFTTAVDGDLPSLIQGADGSFYGVSREGGRFGCGGTAFRMTPAGGVTVLHDFGAAGDGMEPQVLIQGRDGEFYGMTARGGAGFRGCR